MSMPGLIPHLSFLVNRHMFGQLRMIWRGRRRCWWLCHSVALRARFAHRFAIQWEQTKNTISDFLKLFNIQSYPIISNHIQSNIVSHGFSMAKISSFSWGHGGWLHPRPAGHLCPRGAWHGRHHHHCHDPQPICARTHHCGDGGAAPDFIAFCG